MLSNLRKEKKNIKDNFRVEVNSLSEINYKSEGFHSIPEAHKAYVSEIKKQIDEENHVCIVPCLIKREGIGYTTDILKQCAL